MGAWIDATFYNFDVAVYNFIWQFQNPVTVFIADVCQLMGDFRAYMVYLAIAFLLLIPRKTRKYGVALFTAWVIGTLTVNYALKPSVARIRPYETLLQTDFAAVFKAHWEYAGSALETDMSFPSGHTSTNFEMWFSGTLMLNKDKKRWAWVLMLVPIIVGLSRIIRCVHYPSDVLGGMICGLIAGLLGYLIAQLYVKYFKGKKIWKIEL